MPKGTNQKLKLLHILAYLMKNTDENHKVTMPDIIRYLDTCDITAERKSIYTDVEALRDFGIDVIGEKIGKNFYYYIGSRNFEIAELKILVEAIQSSKFITEKKSRELIEKLEKLVSVHESKQLQRQVYVSGRAKTINEAIYYNIDTLHNAIGTNKKISFQYAQWNVKKELELKRKGEFYVVSPWALLWEDENYYLIAFDSACQAIRHYRVDKMMNISSMDLLREGKESFEQFNIAEYGMKNFSMFSGEEEMVKLQVHKELIGVMIDRFGKDIMIVPAENDWFRIHVKVAVSSQFFGWVFGLGKNVKILGPEDVVEKMKNQLEELKSLYFHNV